VDRGEALPERSLAITFDDGCRDFAEHAWPALRRHGFGATLFVVAGEVGGTNRWDQALGEPVRRLLGWDELRALAREGLEVGSHSLTHADLGAAAPAAAERELRVSRELLEDRLERPVRLLAWPFGRFSPHALRLAGAAGYRGACAVLLRRGDLFRSDRYRLRRLTVKRQDRGLRFRLRFAMAERMTHGLRPAPDGAGAA